MRDGASMSLQYQGGVHGQVPLYLPTGLSTVLQAPTNTPSALSSQFQHYDATVSPESLHKERLDGQLFNAAASQYSKECVTTSDVSTTKPDDAKAWTNLGKTGSKANAGMFLELTSYLSSTFFHHPDQSVASNRHSTDAKVSTWVACAKSQIARATCRLLRICKDIQSGQPSSWSSLRKFPNSKDPHLDVDQEQDKQDWQNAWMNEDTDENLAQDGENSAVIPDYVLEYAPLVHLYSGEQFWPCNMTEHLEHTTPTINYTAIQSELKHPTLNNLNDLNKWQWGRWVFLTSNDDPEALPDWLEGAKNIPSTNTTEHQSETDQESLHHPGRSYIQGIKDAVESLKERDDGEYLMKYLRNQRNLEADDQDPPSKLRGGRSEAPAVLIVVNKGRGIVDAFWFYFYSFNLGNSVFNVRFGNHVGDWEHSAIRFHHGKPKAVYFSEHNFGSVYSYDAVEKLGKRPVVYSATGTHAMYATPGLHPYVLPWGILHDQTDRGPLWDPTLNSYTYTYDYQQDLLRASNLTPKAPLGWFYYLGHWGDKRYPLEDKRQYLFAGQYHYVSGPLGPRFKDLGRKKICAGPESAPCVIKHWLPGPSRTVKYQMYGEHADAFSAAAENQWCGWDN